MRYQVCVPQGDEFAILAGFEDETLGEDAKKLAIEFCTTIRLSRPEFPALCVIAWADYTEVIAGSEVDGSNIYWPYLGESA